jgi:L-threonate 2-dehydrogenase
MVERVCEAGAGRVVCDIDPARQRQALAAGAALAETPPARRRLRWQTAGC